MRRNNFFSIFKVVLNYFVIFRTGISVKKWARKKNRGVINSQDTPNTPLYICKCIFYFVFFYFICYTYKTELIHNWLVVMGRVNGWSIFRINDDEFKNLLHILYMIYSIRSVLSRNPTYRYKYFWLHYKVYNNNTLFYYTYRWRCRSSLVLSFAPCIATAGHR